MNEKIRTRLTGERHVLGEQAPLKQPYVLLVDPSNLCNLRCRFCPTGDRDLILRTRRNQTVMDWGVYCKIIDETRAFDEPVKVLRLYKEGEPLLNPRFTDMVSYARECGNIRRIDTTTNGLLLEKNLNRKMIRAGISQVNISVNGVNARQIARYCGVEIDFKRYVEGIRDLYENREACDIYIKAIKENLTEEEQAEFFEIFEGISNRIFLERISPAWPDFQFQDMDMTFETGNYGQPVEDRKVCPYLFYIMVINSDGSVSTCVGDWQHRQIIGHVCDGTIQELWRGKTQQGYWENHLRMNKDTYYMCRNCEVIRYGSFDNLDIWAQEIWQRLQEKSYS